MGGGLRCQVSSELARLRLRVGKRKGERVERKMRRRGRAYQGYSFLQQHQQAPVGWSRVAFSCKHLSLSGPPVGSNKQPKAHPLFLLFMFVFFLPPPLAFLFFNQTMIGDCPPFYFLCFSFSCCPLFFLSLFFLFKRSM